MKKGACLILLLCFLATVFVSAQDLRLPRDPEKLLPRVQRFWTAVAAGQRLQALEFVLPDKKELFLAGTPIPVLKARVVGLDLSADSEHAAVRVSLDVLSTEARSGPLNWMITDRWIWRGNNWYLDLERPPALFSKGGTANNAEVTAIQKQIERDFQLLTDHIDIGTIVEGQYPRFEVPIRYTGDLPVSVELALPNPIVDLEYSSSLGLTSQSKQQLVMVVSSVDWDGPFDLPLSLKIRHEAATVERMLHVKGNVLVPLAFRQSPPSGPIEVGREFSVYIRNNTSEQAAIRYISVDAKFDVIRQPRVIPPAQEAEVVLRLRPGESPDRLYLVLDTALHGRDMFSYRFRNV